MVKVRYRHVIDLDETEEKLLQKAAKKYGGIKRAIIHGLLLLTEDRKEEKPEIDVGKEIEEAVRSVDAQKKRFKHVEVHRMGREALEKEEVREVRTGNCPYCGGIGTPIKALHSQGWIHRLLVNCDCGKKYLVYLGKENLINIKDFEEKLKKKAPECELYPWEKFKEEVIVVRGISSAD